MWFHDESRIGLCCGHCICSCLSFPSLPTPGSRCCRCDRAPRRLQDRPQRRDTRPHADRCIRHGERRRKRRGGPCSTRRTAVCPQHGLGVLSAPSHERQRDRGLLALSSGRLHGAASQPGARREPGMPLLRCNVRRASRHGAAGTDESASGIRCAPARLDAGAYRGWQRDRGYGGDRYAHGLRSAPDNAPRITCGAHLLTRCIGRRQAGRHRWSIGCVILLLMIYQLSPY